MPEAMAMSFVDFVPSLLEKEVQFSTLSLTGKLAGPCYEDFDSLLERANAWFYRVTDAEIYQCEMLEVEGIYDTGEKDSYEPTDDDSQGEEFISTYLRTLRIWFRRNSAVSNVGKKLAYLDVMPARLESTPRAFAPKFQTLSETINSFNKRLHNNEEHIPGKILSMQTCMCRFSPKHCSINPLRTFWMSTASDDMHICYFFRIFYVENDTDYFTGQLGFRDFPPHYVIDMKKNSIKSDKYDLLMEKARDWLTHSKEAPKHVYNIQTLDHHSYFKCVRDTKAGLHAKALENPTLALHNRSPTYHSHVLRVYYSNFTADTHDVTASQKLSSKIRLPWSSQLNVFHKSFHVQRAAEVREIRLGLGRGDEDLLLGNHSHATNQLNQWISNNGLDIVFIETVQVLTASSKNGINLERTHFESYGRHVKYLVHAIRVYVHVPLDRGVKTDNLDFRPEPKAITVSQNTCSIF